MKAEDPFCRNDDRSGTYSNENVSFLIIVFLDCFISDVVKTNDPPVAELVLENYILSVPHFMAALQGESLLPTNWSIGRMNYREMKIKRDICHLMDWLGFDCQ